MANDASLRMVNRSTSVARSARLYRCTRPSLTTLRRAVLVAVQRPDVDDAEFAESLAELRRLAKTLGPRGRRHVHAAARGVRRGHVPRLREARGAEEPGRGRHRRHGPRRPRDHPVAGAQPREGDRRGGDRPHGGDPRDLPPPRALARRARRRWRSCASSTWRRACASRARAATGSAAASAARARASRTSSSTGGRSATASPS